LNIEQGRLEIKTGTSLSAPPDIAVEKHFEEWEHKVVNSLQN